MTFRDITYYGWQNFSVIESTATEKFSNDISINGATVDNDGVIYACGRVEFVAATGGYWMTAPNARKTGSSVGDHGYRLRRVRDNGSQLAEYA